MESERPLKTPLVPAPSGPDAPPPDLRVGWSEDFVGVGDRGGPATAQSVWNSPIRLASGAPGLTISRSESGLLIRYTEVVDFLLLNDGSRIEVRIRDNSFPYAVEIYFLGLVFACWLERGGRLALHGSGVVTDAGGLAFLGQKGTGKSALAAAFLRAGASLLSDDLLSVSPDTLQAAPSYPQVRMWPELARHFVADPVQLPRVEPCGGKRKVVLGDHWDVPMAAKAAPLRRIYLPERRPAAGAGDVRIEGVRPAEALMELVQESFLVTILHALGLQAARLERLGKLVLGVPVRRLVYPSGLNRLQTVVEAVKRDMESAREPEVCG